MMMMMMMLLLLMMMMLMTTTYCNICIMLLNTVWTNDRRSGILMGNRYGPGSEEQPIWLQYVQCTGSERSITKCGHDDWGQHNCSHSEDVSIRCGDDGPSMVY